MASDSEGAELQEHLPTEDFLASIGLQPRDMLENSSPSARRNSVIPSGWRRELVQRKMGKTAGKYDVYIYSPDGHKFRSKTELELYVKKNDLDINVGDFCFTVRGHHLLDIVSNRTHNGDSSNLKLLDIKRKRSEILVDGRLNDTANDEAAPKRRRKTISSEQVLAGVSKTSNVKSPKSASRVQNGVVRSKTLMQQSVSHAKKCAAVAKPAGKLFVRMNFSAPVKKNGTDVLNRSSDDLFLSDDETKPVTNGHRDSALSRTLTVRRPSAAGESNNPKSAIQLMSPKFSGLPNGNMSSPSKRNVFAGVLELRSTGKWVPPQSPFNLVEEALFYSSWRILIASIILENGQEENKRKALWEFFELWPSVEDVLGATWQQVHRQLQTHGIDEETCRTLLKFSEEYLTKNWGYPDELFGIKKYGNDAYRIFCINEWKQVAPDNPKLNEYHRWLWSNHRALGID